MPALLHAEQWEKYVREQVLPRIEQPVHEEPADEKAKLPEFVQHMLRHIRKNAADALTRPLTPEEKNEIRALLLKLLDQQFKEANMTEFQRKKVIDNLLNEIEKYLKNPGKT